MEMSRNYCLYPLYLLYNSKERYHRVDPQDLSKDFLRQLVEQSFGVRNAFEMCQLQNMNFGPRGVSRLETDEDVAQFAEQFKSLHFAKITLVDRSKRARGDAGSAKGASARVAAGAPAGADASQVSIPVTIPAEHFNSLLDAIQKLEISLKKTNDQLGQKPAVRPGPAGSTGPSPVHLPVSSVDDHCKTIHCDVVCDGCHPVTTFTASPDTAFIRGPRFKCLYCHNYDLCSPCVAKGVETATHKKYHNMLKLNVPDANIINQLSGTHSCAQKCQTRARAPAPPAAPLAAGSAPGFAVQTTRQEVLIDIPESQDQVFSFFANIKSVTELSAMIEKCAKFDALEQQVGGDWTSLENAVKLMASSTTSFETLAEDSGSQLASVDANRDEVSDEDDLILVELIKKDHLISFKLHNRGIHPVSSGLKLVFQYFETADANPVKCTLHMGPHEFQADSHKILNFNYRGLIDNFSTSHSCKIDLVDQDDTVVFTGSSAGSSTLVLRPAAMPDVQTSVYLEAQSSTSGLDSLNAHDVISTTATNEESTKFSSYDSEVEDYDYLSGSDLEK
ncbi:LAMI_0C07052g1_1 [Lachancea mirantina]|uniref:LAMI_0C07052g1_1 n=1 Tax=Lachancea mirantina TaxID=1230905 RepID=A0A1G4J3Q2_9SACH|nr:LAMI_0C07052g1_1 [Lachancea mirantina]